MPLHADYARQVSAHPAGDCLVRAAAIATRVAGSSPLEPDLDVFPAGHMGSARSEQRYIPAWRVRDFHADDLDATVRLWDDLAASSEAPTFSLSALLRPSGRNEADLVRVR